MNEEKVDHRQTVDELSRGATRVLITVLTVAIAVVILGVAVIPAAAAYSCGNWRILLAYPVILIVSVFLVSLAPSK